MKPIFFLLFMCLTTHTIFAQNDTTKVQSIGTVEIYLKDGSILKGKVQKSTPNALILIHETLGEVTVPKAQIAEIKMSQQKTINQKISSKKEALFSNPNPMTYFVMPSGFHPEVGKVYYHNQYVFFNAFEFGMTPDFSVKLGFEVLSIYTGNPIFYIMPKYSFPIAEKLRVGIGVLGFFFASLNESFTSERQILGFGAGTGFLTYGTHENHITAGIGYGFGAETNTPAPFYTLSGTARLSRKINLVVENWFVPWRERGAYFGLGSAGIRVLGKKSSIDIGLARPMSMRSEFELFGVPYFGFSMPF